MNDEGYQPLDIHQLAQQDRNTVGEAMQYPSKAKAPPEWGFLRACGRMNLAGGEESAEVAGAFRGAELAERLGFDLTDAFAGDVELLADLF